MQSIVFNFSQSGLHQKVEAVTLKIGYLLCNEVCTAGTTCNDIYSIENFSDRSLFEKLDFLESVSRRDNSKFLKEVREMRTLMKKMHGAGAKTPKQHASRREGEQLINITYESFVQIYQNSIKDYGFEELKKLTKDDNFLFYAMNNNPEDPTGNRITASDLLQRLLVNIPEEEATEKEPYAEPEIFLLGAEFLKDDYSKPKIYGSTETEAKHNDTMYLHHALTLTGFEQLTADEVRNLRITISETTNSFNQKVNEWIDMCYFNISPSERLSFFNNQIVPAATELHQAIEDNFILSNDDCSEKKLLPIEVWLGEMPVSQLWKYYRDHGVIKDVTWRKIQREKALQNERWPVMMLRIPEGELQLFINKTDDEETTDEMIDEMSEKLLMSMSEKPKQIKVDERNEEIRASKKYILID